MNPDCSMQRSHLSCGESMENTNMSLSRRKKENIPPLLSHYLQSEHRNVQKNVNVNLYLGAGRQVEASHHWPSADALTVTPGWEVEPGRTVPAVKGKGAKKRDPSLIQSNFPCASQPLRAAVSPLSDFCSQQQNNLYCRLQRCSSGKVACGKPLLPSAAPPHVDLQQRYSCFDAGRAGTGENVSVHQSRRDRRKPKEVVSPWDQSSVQCPSRRFPDGGNQSTEQAVKKQQHGPHVTYGTDHGDPLLASTEFLSPRVVPVIASAGLLPHHAAILCPSPRSSKGSVNSFCPEPALILDELGAPNLAEPFSSSTALQSLLQSSKTSASLHCSIQKLQQEAAFMGIWNSLPSEPRSSPRACRMCFAPAVLSVGEQLARDQSSAKQARMKWVPPFVRDWDLGSVSYDLGEAEPAFLCQRCRNIELYVQRSKASGWIWPGSPCTGASSVCLVDTEAGSSHESCPYHRCQSRAPRTQGDGTFGYIKTNFPERPFGAEESFARAAPCAVCSGKALPSMSDPDDLQVSLETQKSGSPVTVSVTVYGTPREVHLKVRSPPGDAGIGQDQQFSIGSIDVSASEPPGEDQGQSVKACDIMLSAARGTAMVNSGQSVPGHSNSLLRGTANQGLSEPALVASDMDGTNAPSEGRIEEHSQEVCRDQGLRADQDQSENLPVARGIRKLQNCKESSQDPESNFPRQEMKERSSQLLCNRQQLAWCFQVWSSYILRKRTAARELYRHQLLRKGLGALQWAVQLRKVQMEIAQRRHALIVLAVSFHRWKEAAVKRNKSQISRLEPMTATQDSPRGPAARAPVWSRLTTGSQQELMWPSRVEADLWRRFHRRQRADELCWRIQAIRDLRRLAAAFRLWRLQKELLDKEEARVQEARALLEKKQLQSIFRTWRLQSLETKRIWPVLTLIRREQATQCFQAWRQFVEWKTLCRHSLEHHRAGYLRKSFRQWVLMLQHNEMAKRTMMNLLILKQRRCYGQQTSWAAGGPVTEDNEAYPCLAVRRWSLGKRNYSLDELCQRMKLQRIFLLWKARLCQQQQADSFSQALEQRRLREALKWWRQRTLQLNPLNQSPRAPPKKPLTLLDSEESSLSSGFHSNSLTALVSQGLLEKESSFWNSSRNSLSSILTTEESKPASQCTCCLLQHCCPGVPAGLGEALCLQTSSPLQSPQGRGNQLMGGCLQAPVLCHPNSGIQPLASYSAWEEMRFRGDAWQDDSSGDELESVCFSLWRQAERWLLQKYFLVWSTQTQQHIKTQQHYSLVLLSRTLLGWHKWVVEDKKRKAMASQYHGLCCCQAAFDLWKRRLAQKVEADRRFRHQIRQRAADALQCWHTCWQKQCTLRDLQLQWTWHSTQQRKRIVLQAWHCQAVKYRSATLCRERLFLRRVLVAWARLTICGPAQHKALAQFELARQQRTLAFCFAQWRTGFLRAQKWAGEDGKPPRAAYAKSFQRWRVATRGHQALHLGATAAVEQACKYWTKAAALSQSSRQQCTLIGARKCRKMPLSWSRKSRGCTENGLGPSAASYHRLLASSFHHWLVIYRNHSRKERLSVPVHQLLERTDVVEGAPGHVRAQESCAELEPDEQYRRWLGTRYVRRWRRHVLLCRLQRSRRTHSLVGRWMQWKDACRTALVVRVLVGQRLLEWGWRIWRRRYLQSRVSQGFLEGEDLSLLNRAFGRWHQLTTSRLEERGHC